MNNLMFECSPQIFAQSKRDINDISPIGTSVLLKYEDEFFLVTAKHVLQELENYDLYIPLKNDFLKVGGKWDYLTSALEYDNIDVAILRLDEELIEPILTKYKFIKKGVINVDYTENEDDYFIIMGFPIKRTNRDGRSFTTDPFFFITSQIRLKKINKIFLNEEDNITVRYRRNDQSFMENDFKSQGPKDLRGISGCGLWHFRKEVNFNGSINLSLVGIVIEADINRGIICATRVKWLVQLISQNYNINE